MIIVDHHSGCALNVIWIYLDDLDCFDAHPPNVAAGCDGGYRSPFLIYASVWLTGSDSSEKLCIIRALFVSTPV